MSAAIYPPKTEIDKTNSVLFLIGMRIFTSFYAAIFCILERIKFYVNKIEPNEKTIKIFEDKMDMQDKFHRIDKRLALLESNRFEANNFYNNSHILLLISKIFRIDR